MQSEPLSEEEAEAQVKTEAESESESLAEAGLEAKSEVESKTESEDPVIMVLNGTGKSGVAAYWKRILSGKGLTHITMADYKGSVTAHTVVYLKDGGNAPQAVSQCFPSAEYLAGELTESVTVAQGEDEYDSYDMWIVVGKDDALHD